METISVTRKGIELLISQINELHPRAMASAELLNGIWIIGIVGGRIRCFHSTIEAIQFLRGVIYGIGLMDK